MSTDVQPGISWDPSGIAFKSFDTASLEEMLQERKIAESYPKLCDKLTKLGFKRVVGGTYDEGWFHPYFVKGRADFLSGITPVAK